jgi:hypothetical protein
VVTDAEQIVLSLSGLDQSELCWMKRLLRALGITLAQTFSRRSTHLLCPSACGAKYDKAKEWNIPILGMTWLEDMVNEGKVPDVGEYLIGDVGDRLDKGKTKEDVEMIDITKVKGKPEYRHNSRVVLTVLLSQAIQPLHYSQRSQIYCITSEFQHSLISTKLLQPHSSPSQIARLIRLTTHSHSTRTTTMCDPQFLHLHCHRKAALLPLNTYQLPLHARP